MALSYNYSTLRIGVPQVDAQPLTMQTLINSIRTQEASERGIIESQIADASGKNDLGGGVQTGITVDLRSTWQLEFAAGAYQATVSGGNLSDALNAIYNTGSPQVLVQASASATVVTVATGSGVTAQDKTDIISGVISAAEATPIHADLRKVSGTTIAGSGTEGDPWGPA